jgi:hypothetical protein
MLLTVVTSLAIAAIVVISVISWENSKPLPALLTDNT